MPCCQWAEENNISQKGWGCLNLLSLIIVMLISATTRSVWWVVEFSSCPSSTHLSIWLSKGLCKTNEYGGRDDSNCKSWDDSSYWSSIDDAEGTNTEDAATNVYPAVETACIIALCCSIISLMLTFCQHCLKSGSGLRFFSRLLLSVSVFVSGFLMLYSIGSANDNNDIADPDSYTYNPSTDLASCTNSTKPYAGFICAVISMVLLISLDYCLVRPGVCCFVNIKEDAPALVRGERFRPNNNHNNDEEVSLHTPILLTVATPLTAHDSQHSNSSLASAIPLGGRHSNVSLGGGAPYGQPMSNSSHLPAPQWEQQQQQQQSGMQADYLQPSAPNFVY